MESLLAACPELAAALVSSDTVKQSRPPGSTQPTSDTNGSGSSGCSDSSGSSGSTEVAQSNDQQADAAASAALLYKVAAVEVVDLSATAGSGGVTVKAGKTEQRKAGHVSPQQLQQSEDTHLAAAVLQLTASAAETARIPAEIATAGHLSTAPILTGSSADCSSSSSSSRDLLAVTAAFNPTANAVIPLPYAHYKLVGGDGGAVERPDKHPFALSRVLYDAR